jgi:hypothetical protein
VLNQLGLALGGEAGNQLTWQLQMNVSGDTILRTLHQTMFKPVSNPKVLGIDNWAFARGRRYRTILVDLERGALDGPIERHICQKLLKRQIYGRASYIYFVSEC